MCFTNVCVTQIIFPVFVKVSDGCFDMIVIFRIFVELSYRRIVFVTSVSIASIVADKLKPHGTTILSVKISVPLL